MNDHEFDIQREYIDPMREATLTVQVQDALKGIPKKDNQLRSRFRRYGWDYLSDLNMGPAPDWIPHICGFDSWTLNEYPEGHFIAPHIDSDKFGDEIWILSLGVPSKLKFISPCGEEVIKDLPNRSLARFCGELRRKWKHCTLPTNAGYRYSIIYRKLGK